MREGPDQQTHPLEDTDPPRICKQESIDLGISEVFLFQGSFRLVLAYLPLSPLGICGCARAVKPGA